LLIAIDGPAGTGKSTVAKMLAARLGALYLDTGALYRAVACKVKAAGIDAGDGGAVARILLSIDLRLERQGEQMTVVLDGRMMSHELRTPEISRLASVVSAIPAVRDWLLPVQREVAASGSVVAEGRDIGTRVFPQADVKFFLEADLEVRAARRHRELADKQAGQSFADTRNEVKLRDARDRAREVAPLIPAQDAHVIDTSTLDVRQVLDRMMAIIAAKL
jgi:cytidylate kinase